MVELTDSREGSGRGEEPNHTTARKPGPLVIIQYSLPRCRSRIAVHNTLFLKNRGLGEGARGRGLCGVLRAPLSTYACLYFSANKVPIFLQPVLNMFYIWALFPSCLWLRCTLNTATFFKLCICICMTLRDTYLCYVFVCSELVACTDMQALQFLCFYDSRWVFLCAVFVSIPSRWSWIPFRCTVFVWHALRN